MREEESAVLAMAGPPAATAALPAATAAPFCRNSLRLRVLFEVSIG